MRYKFRSELAPEVIHKRLEFGICQFGNAPNKTAQYKWRKKRFMFSLCVREHGKLNRATFYGQARMEKDGCVIQGRIRRQLRDLRWLWLLPTQSLLWLLMFLILSPDRRPFASNYALFLFKLVQYDWKLLLIIIAIGWIVLWGVLIKTDLPWYEPKKETITFIKRYLLH